MIAHIVSVSPEIFVDLSSKLTPAIRCVDTEHFPLPHFWVYAPDLSVIVFTCVPIEERTCAKLTTPDGLF